MLDIGRRIPLYPNVNWCKCTFLIKIEDLFIGGVLTSNGHDDRIYMQRNVQQCANEP